MYKTFPSQRQWQRTVRRKLMLNPLCYHHSQRRAKWGTWKWRWSRCSPARLHRLKPQPVQVTDFRAVVLRAFDKKHQHALEICTDLVHIVFFSEVTWNQDWWFWSTLNELLPHLLKFKLIFLILFLLNLDFECNSVWLLAIVYVDFLHAFIFFKKYVFDVSVGRDSSSPVTIVNGMKVVKISTPRLETVSVSKKICVIV